MTPALLPSSTLIVTLDLPQSFFLQLGLSLCASTPCPPQENNAHDCKLQWSYSCGTGWVLPYLVSRESAHHPSPPNLAETGQKLQKLPESIPPSWIMNNMIAHSIMDNMIAQALFPLEKP